MAASTPKGPTLVMLNVVPIISFGVVVPWRALSTSTLIAEAIPTRSSWSAPLMFGTISPRGVSAAIPRLTLRRTITSFAVLSKLELIPGKCRAASHTASAMIVSGERRTPDRFGCCLSEATRSIVRVASTRTHTAARGCVNALCTIASAIERSTPLTGMRSSLGPIDHDSSSRPTKRDVVFGPVMGALTRGVGVPGTPTPRVSAPITGPNTTSRFVGRELESWSIGPKEERIPVKGVLRSMAEAMVQSAFTQPRAAVWVRVDATRTMDLVASLKQQPNLSGVRLSPLTIIALAVCDAARHFPGINSSFDSTANEVIVRRSVNLGIAADTPRGLIVPNIKGADQLDLVGMASAMSVLVDKARQGTTTPNEMIGTTLSITNVGPFGVDAAIPILPPGTGAILAVGQIAKSPWVVDDEVVVRQVVELAMAFDHRQVDGAMASAVLAHIGRFLHDPAAAIIAG